MKLTVLLQTGTEANSLMGWPGIIFLILALAAITIAYIKSRRKVWRVENLSVGSEILLTKVKPNKHAVALMVQPPIHTGTGKNPEEGDYFKVHKKDLPPKVVSGKVMKVVSSKEQHTERVFLDDTGIIKMIPNNKVYFGYMKH